MSGYRQSNYDPAAYQQPGQPLRPYNWVQWSGVFLTMVGVAINIVYLTSFFGWMHPVISSPGIANVLILLGIVLINSRRFPGDSITELQRTRNQRLLIITAAICAIILGAAAIVTLFTGA